MGIVGEVGAIVAAQQRGVFTDDAHLHTGQRHGMLAKGQVDESQQHAVTCFTFNQGRERLVLQLGTSRRWLQDAGVGIQTYAIGSNGIGVNTAV